MEVPPTAIATPVSYTHLDVYKRQAEHGLVNEYYLLEQDIYQVEVLNQLDQVPAVGALISIAFPHWDKATGSPVRAVAILP